MDRELIIRLAREAHEAMLASGRGMYLWHGEAYAGDVQDFCERFATVVAAHEREECAKVCEERKINPAAWMIDKFYNQAVEHCVAAIRSRT